MFAVDYFITILLNVNGYESKGIKNDRIICSLGVHFNERLLFFNEINSLFYLFKDLYLLYYTQVVSSLKRTIGFL